MTDAVAVLADPHASPAASHARLRRALGAGAVLAGAGPVAVGATGAGVAALVGAGDPVVAALLAGRDDVASPTRCAPRVGWSAGGDRLAVVRGTAAMDALHVVRTGDRLVVASEVALLLALLPRAPEPDETALALWLAGRPLGRRTLHAGIRPLPVGHALLWEAGALRELVTWRPRPRPAPTLRAALDEAVATAQDGASTSAVLLSGGIDSTAVAAVAAGLRARDGRPPPTAVTATFPGHPELDESSWVEATCAHLGLAVERVPTRPASLLDDLEGHLDRWGLPREHPGPALMAPALRAAGRGADVVLGGEGGDDLLGCVPYLIGDEVARGRLVRAWRLSDALPELGPLPPALRRRALRRYVLAPRAARLRPAAPAPAWLTPATARRAASADVGWAWTRAPGARWSAWLGSHMTHGLQDAGVGDGLRHARAEHGARTAHPLLDPALLEAVLGADPAAAFDAAHDRPVLRAAVAADLPPAVVARQGKTDFGALVRASLALDAERLRDVVAGPLELAGRVDARALRAAVARLAADPAAGSADVRAWRAVGLELWLRRLAGRA